ncbi:hypothetical protein PpBr36_06981 [Pyricularia pennisetigena]|uniref:hypothetical protein n=1 Tax=Pyricularia pennisetigena TaxID=1578925 RepID=UPI0011505A07|nr:hypothetical protein PpBr36_06981 [Pyricularia pennisetigena]TLS25191.1 hypothetical protein PpBr36_06981 [Pyricularia pennisetigena]
MVSTARRSAMDPKAGPLFLVSIQSRPAVVTSTDNTTQHAQDESQLPVAPPAMMLEPTQLLGMEPPYPTEYLPSLSASKSGCNTSSTVLSHSFTHPNNGYLGLPSSRASAWEETVVSSLSGGSDAQGYRASFAPAQTDVSSQPQRFDGFTSVGLTPYMFSSSEQFQGFDPDIVHSSMMVGLTTDEVLAATGGGTNPSGVLPQNQDFQCTMEEPNIDCYPQTLSNIIPREKRIQKVISNADQQFPNTDATQHSHSGVTPRSL